MAEFNFSQFEREAASLLAQMRKSAETAAAFEREARAGRVTRQQAEARVSEPAPRTRAGEAPGGRGLTEEIRTRGLATDQLIARQRALTAAEQGSVQAERQMAQVMGQNSAATRTSGALTNEFVDAAKRGEVTVRELGNEVTSTIAKFGGWIVAGSAVYFAFDALTAVKRGAIDASSGVNQLERVVNNVSSGKAQESFRSLAGEFNVPIKDAADAAYEMGKVFGNQNDAFEAARQVLYAVKIGELDTAAASRYLISIINGFHLPASQMAKVLDQVNQAQNNFGVSTEDVLSGVAKASGTFHQASGEFKKYGQDYSYLLALITTGVKVTGQTGPTIGTAIARSPNFLRRPSNQETLRQFGIDPEAPIETVYNEAFKKVKDLSGKQVQELAAAIGGPQYGARVFTGILSNYDQFQKVLGDTSPAKSQGSAQRELDKQLSGVDEQISKVGTSLERLGAGLAEGHFFDSFGLALQTLNQILETANSLATAFNQLPEPVQQSLAYLVQVSLLMKTMRRLNLGETIAGGPGATPGAGRGAAAGLFGFNSPQAYARQTRKAFIIEEEALQKERARLGSQLYSGQRRETLAFGAAGAAHTNLRQAVGRYGPLSPEAAEAQTKFNAAQADATAQAQRNLALVTDEKVATERLAAVQASIANTRKRIVGGLNVEATLREAERLNYPVPPGFQKGGTQRPVTISRQSGSSTASGIILPPGVQTEAQRAATSADAGAKELGRTSSRFGVVTGSMGRLKTGLGGFSNSLGAMLGATGNILFAAFGISFLINALNEQLNNVADEFDAAQENADSAKEAGKRYQELGHHGRTFSDAVNDAVSELGKYPAAVTDLFNKGPGAAADDIYNGAPGTQEVIQLEEESIKKGIEARRILQQRYKSEGKPVPARYVSDIERDIEDVKHSGKSNAEIRRALNRYEVELRKSVEAGRGNKADKQAVQEALASAQRGQVDAASNQTLVEKLQVLQTKEIQARLKASVGKVGGSYGVTFDPQAAKKAGLIYQAIVQKIGGANDSESLEALAQARQEYFDGVTQAVQNELSIALELSKSPQQSNQAYRQAFTRLQAFGGSADQAVSQQAQAVQKLKEQRRRLQRKQDEALSPQEAKGFGVEPFDASKQLRELSKEIGLETEKLKKLKEQKGEQGRFLREIIQKLREQQYEANSALRQARENAREALSADPIAQAQQKLRFLGNEIEQAIKIYGRNSTEVLTLITEQRQTQQQLIQNQLGLIQAKSNLETAGILQQVPKEKATLYGPNGLLSQLRFAEAHADQFDPKALIELQAQVRAAQVQLAFDIQQEANQLAEARFGIREARAEFNSNPVTAAKIAVEKAKYEVAHAQTPLDKLAAQQNLIQARGAKRDAVAQARLESIQFEASIEKITTQQEIEQLEGLLANYKLSLAMRRQIREQIHSLKGQLNQEGQAFNLNVGDFSLPTAYDIRRAVLSGNARGAAPTVTQHNSFKVNNYSSDPNVVGRAIGQALGGAAESAARSAGVA